MSDRVHERRARPAISVVVPVYNEVQSIGHLHSGLERALAGLDGETVVVDDGSTDASAAEIARYPDFRCVKITHAGKSLALAAGVQAARGETVVTIDADLQEDPVQICELLHELDKGADLAVGYRCPRVDGLWKKRIPSFVYRQFLRVLFGRDFRDINCGFRAARREVWEKIAWFDGAHRLVPALVVRQGGKIAEIPVRHRRRLYGQAKFDSPWRFFEGIRDACKVRFGPTRPDRREAAK